MSKTQILEKMSHITGILRGYELPWNVLAKYKCSFCGVSGTKLWRGIGTASEAWCSKCGMAQAGLADTLDAKGEYEGEYGHTCQIYSPKKGENLVPWIPCPDGHTWSFGAVPPEGCVWWETLPTRIAG